MDLNLRRLSIYYYKPKDEPSDRDIPNYWIFHDKEYQNLFNTENFYRIT